MELPAVLLGVAAVWGLAVVTPGPNFFITAQTTVRHPGRAGFFVVLGTCTGTLIWASAGYFGITGLFKAAPWLYTTLKIAGGTYLIYLGMMMILNSGKAHDSHQALAADSRRNLTNWRKGLVTNLSNPKTAMFVASLFATVLSKDPDPVTGLMIILLMVLISLAWYSLVVMVFSSRKIRQGYTRIQHWLEKIAGAVFAGFGLRLVLSDD